MVDMAAPPCLPRRDSSSALETKLQPEAMFKSVSGLPREIRGGSGGKGGDLNSGHECLSGAAGPEPRCVRAPSAWLPTAQPTLQDQPMGEPLLNSP